MPAPAAFAGAGAELQNALYPLTDQVSAPRDALDQTVLAQLGLFIVEYATAQLWISWGVEPTALIGHSVGEFVAAVLADVFELPDALELVAARAQLMQELPKGSMLAVRLPEFELRPLLASDLAIAAVNSPIVTIISGPTDAIARAAAEFTQRAISCRQLSTSHAFHSPMMEPILDRFTALVAAKRRGTPTRTWISTLTGELVTSADVRDPAYWSRQIRNPVRFSAALGQLTTTDLILLEVGPGTTLANLARQHTSLPQQMAILSSFSPQADGEQDLAAIYQAVGELWGAGYDVPWTRLYAGERRRKVRLPTYPFERQRYWIEPPQFSPAESSSQPHASALIDGAPPQTQPCVAPTAAPDPVGRQDQVALRVRAILQDLSGADLSTVADHVSFTELGFDSLFLTQFVQELQRKFQVKITFRQLMGDLATIGALGQFLEAQQPPSSAPKSTAEPISAGEPQRPIANGHHSAPLAATATDANNVPLRFGPYRPPDSRPGGPLDERQQRALRRLSERYVAKTPRSKAYTQQHRPRLADPRAVAGFRPDWKELVYPLVVESSAGSRLRDLDGNEYVDLTMGFGVNFLGHSPEFVTRALHEQLQTGIEIGPQAKRAGEVAELLCEFTGMDRVSFCNTGSEAVMAALRLARTATGRDKVVYFTGGYHGTFDQVLIRGHAVNGTYRSVPVAPGIPQSIADNLIVLEYGTAESLTFIRRQARDLAAVLVEPVQSRRPDLQPVDFLQALRDITAESGTALIFDEVVTGFRSYPGGAQARFGIRADLATYGKVIGGGIPIGVIAGQAKYMDALDGGQWQFGDDSFPEIGVTFFAGTFVRHPLALAAAQAVLGYLKQQGEKLQLELDSRTARLVRTINAHCAAVEAPLRLSSFSSLFMIEYPHELKLASLLWYYLRDRGIHVWEGRPCFLSTVHTDADLERVVQAFAESIAEMQAGGLLPGPQEPCQVPSPLFPAQETSPLTDAETEVLYSATICADANCAYNEAHTLRFAGALDIAALRFGLQRLLDRHAALRSAFAADGQSQVYVRELPLVLPEDDYSPWTERVRQARVAAAPARETATPFELVAGPLVRFRLLKLAPTDHLLLMTTHHLVCDGWSWGMLIEELSRLYNAYRAGRLCHLPRPTSFADFARWTHSPEQQAALVAAEHYWKVQFADGAPQLELPIDRPRPACKSFAAAVAKRRLPAERYRELKSASPRLAGTIFSTLLTAFATLLHRISGQDDLVIGVPAAGQPRFGCQQLIGHCLNLLPIRLRPTARRPFAEFAASVKQQVLQAYDHQNLTFGRLLQQLDLPRDPSRLPLVSVAFNVDRMGIDALHFDGLEFEFAVNPKQFTNFELFFNVIQSDAHLEIECEFNTDLFRAETVQAWLQEFEMILETALTDPSRALAQTAVQGARDRRAIDRDPPDRVTQPEPGSPSAGIDVRVQRVDRDQFRRPQPTTSQVPELEATG